MKKWRKVCLIIAYVKDKLLATRYNLLVSLSQYRKGYFLTLSNNDRIVLDIGFLQGGVDQISQDARSFC